MQETVLVQAAVSLH